MRHPPEQPHHSIRESATSRLPALSSILRSSPPAGGCSQSHPPRNTAPPAASSGTWQSHSSVVWEDRGSNPPVVSALRSPLREGFLTAFRGGTPHGLSTGNTPSCR